MKFENLLARTAPNGLFRTGDILAGAGNPAAVRRQLNRWKQSGRIHQLRREVYCVRAPYRTDQPHPFAIANLLRRGSYVSLQSALSHYGMIPEHVPMVTSVTGGRPETLATPAGRFRFRHLGANRFFGFAERAVAPGEPAWIATPEKALVDLLYLSPGSDSRDFLEELRLAFPERFPLGRLMETGLRMQSAKVDRALRILEQLMNEGTFHETTLD